MTDKVTDIQTECPTGAKKEESLEKEHKQVKASWSCGHSTVMTNIFEPFAMWC